MSETSHIHTDDIIVDSDVHFAIDTITRSISNQNADKVNKKLTIMQYDNKSERYSFDIDKIIDGHDLTLCNRVQIHFINIGSNKQKNIGLYLVDDVHTNPDNSDKITFSWLISENATQLSGILSFLVSFECVDGDKVIYRWSSSIFSNIQIVAGMDNDNTIAELYVDELLTWQNNMQMDYIPALVDECYIEREFATSEEVAHIFNMAAPAEIFDEYIEDASVEGNVLSLSKNDGSILTFEPDISNPNLLINGDFSINTSGRDVYQTTQSRINTVDMWVLFSNSASNLTFDTTTKVLSNTSSVGGYFMQYINGDLLWNKTYTLSVKIDGNVVSQTITFPSKPTSSQGVSSTIVAVSGKCNIRLFYYSDTDKVGFTLDILENSSVTLEYAKLEIGSVATAYSPNVVESYLLNNMSSNPNLLINGDFRVNQRGETSYKGLNKYTVDRWFLGSSDSFLNYDETNKQIESIGVSGVTETGTPRIILRQFIEDWQKFIGKTLTVSMKYENFTEDVVGTTMLTIYDGKGRTDIPLSSVGESGFIMGTRTIREDATLLIAEIRITGTGKNASLKPKWVKLEVGDIATPHSPRPYAEELAMCQRYYQIIKAISAYSPFCSAYLNTTSQAMGLINFVTEMRTTPTLTYNGDFQVRNSQSANVGVTNVNIDGASTLCINIKFTASSTVDTEQGKYVQIRSLNNANTYIAFDAEIY